jgi:hypothetical protein
LRNFRAYHTQDAYSVFVYYRHFSRTARACAFGVFFVFVAKSARQLSWCALSRAPFFRCVGWIALTRGSARAPPPRSSLRTSHDVPKQARERGADAANGVAAAGASRVAREARSSTDEMCLARGFLKTESLEPSTRGRSRGSSRRGAREVRAGLRPRRAPVGPRTRRRRSSPARDFSWHPTRRAPPEAARSPLLFPLANRPCRDRGGSRVGALVERDRNTKTTFAF